MPAVPFVAQGAEKGSCEIQPKPSETSLVKILIFASLTPCRGRIHLIYADRTQVGVAMPRATVCETAALGFAGTICSDAGYLQVAACRRAAAYETLGFKP